MIVRKNGQRKCNNQPIKDNMEVESMRSKERVTDAFMILFFAIFAMPFFGGYMMLNENRETKFIGGILCFVGLAIWLLIGIN